MDLMLLEALKNTHKSTVYKSFYISHPEPNAYSTEQRCHKMKYAQRFKSSDVKNKTPWLGELYRQDT